MISNKIMKLDNSENMDKDVLFVKIFTNTLRIP